MISCAIFHHYKSTLLLLETLQTISCHKPWLLSAHPSQKHRCFKVSICLICLRGSNFHTMLMTDRSLAYWLLQKGVFLHDWPWISPWISAGYAPMHCQMLKIKSCPFILCIYQVKCIPQINRDLYCHHLLWIYPHTGSVISGFDSFVIGKLNKLLIKQLCC